MLISYKNNRQAVVKTRGLVSSKCLQIFKFGLLRKRKLNINIKNSACAKPKNCHSFPPYNSYSLPSVYLKACFITLLFGYLSLRISEYTILWV